jgi:putative nucleotidyltransferase with HDIG domain
MSLEPSLEDQALLEETLHRAGLGMTGRELLWSALSAAGLVAAVAVLWAIDPPHGFSIAPAVACLVVLVISINVRFDTPLGYAAPIELAFVPLVFALPPAIVPVAVVGAFALAALPRIMRGHVPPSRLLIQGSNAWFSIGPATVFAIAHVDPWHAGPVLLVAALAAQFLTDFTLTTVGFAIVRGASFSSLVAASWVYGIDTALAAPGLLAAESVHRDPLAAVALVPLLGLLAVFAHERRGRLQSMIELSNAYRGTALVLGDVIESDDGYTGAHCKSVVSLALNLAEQLRLSPERQRNLEFAALLHDVGKVAIPKEIVNKPDKLDPHEWAIIKTHTVEGQKMLDRVGGFMREVGLIVRAHHERWDGGGYPDGLAGEQIPLEARIIGCCDTWNAMRTDRPYRKALAYEIASAELRAASGTQLDPDLVEALLRLVASEAPVDKPEPVTSDAAGVPQPRPEYGYAPQAC